MRNRNWEKNRYHSDPEGQNYLRFKRRLRARIIEKRRLISELEKELRTHEEEDS